MANKPSQAEISKVMRELGRRGGKAKVAKGFAALSPEEREAARLKGLETRRKNAAKKK